MGRELTIREREVAAFLILHGRSLLDTPAVAEPDRQQWLSQLLSAQAGPKCECGKCPSIELQDEWGETPEEGERVMLHASAPGAEVTMFIDDRQLSYLELTPLNEVGVLEFPSPRLLAVDPTLP